VFFLLFFGLFFGPPPPPSPPLPAPCALGHPLTFCYFQSFLPSPLLPGNISSDALATHLEIFLHLLKFMHYFRLFLHTIRTSYNWWLLYGLFNYDFTICNVFVVIPCCNYKHLVVIHSPFFLSQKFVDCILQK